MKRRQRDVGVKKFIETSTANSSDHRNNYKIPTLESSHTPWMEREYDVLLIDPPRAGLDRNVTEMAIVGNFQHIIYVSCGRKALIRDLNVLAPYFDVASTALLDLFPGTDAVETLVHLQRKPAA
mmetsp:Transcript_42932/g.100780  ORF Transcript_42932/g.100780 Transcript_42932/m.100780 type:complete len:124 (-) Transcript_42932:74-445(-)